MICTPGWKTKCCTPKKKNQGRKFIKVFYFCPTLMKIRDMIHAASISQKSLTSVQNKIKNLKNGKQRGVAGRGMAGHGWARQGKARIYGGKDA